ncbi:Hypothetical membrane protein [Corynebacterium glutamicum ATCC 13032]|uniref:Hypothetical membrane protein n=2 Tax=Corynebacterium glutamicum TaxID=1718 RepID=Q8NPI0_CORGL|nr:Hypothetical membrane protein [Corynebacterium glutamicum ATCC 13032]
MLQMIETYDHYIVEKQGSKPQVNVANEINTSNNIPLPEMYSVFLLAFVVLVIATALLTAILEWRNSHSLPLATLWGLISCALPFAGPLFWIVISYFKNRKK